MQSQDHGQLLNPHPLLRLLVTAAVVALELVLAAQSLCVAEAAQAVRDAGVEVHVNLQVEEVFVLAADRLAIEAARLAGEDSLEDLMDPGWLMATTGTAVAGTRFGLARVLIPLS